MQKQVQLLDCTLRDGGQGLEDLNKNGINTDGFMEKDRTEIAQHLANAKIDIIELGCMDETSKDTLKYAIYQNIQDLSKNKPKKQEENQMFVGLYRGPDTDIDSIPRRSPETVDGVRVILRYSELQKSLDYCSKLAEKGYEVFVQPMLTMRYSDDELIKVINAANDMNAYAVYFVDSYGYMDEFDVQRLFKIYNEKLKTKIRIGFHAHNNMQMANSNVRTFINCASANRKIIVDSCAIGMGQGAGNMQTELAVPYLNMKYGKSYDLNQVLEVCELLDKFRIGEMNTWGYSPVRAISAIHKVAYKYAVSMRIKKDMKLPEINYVLERMPQNLKYRYTDENLEKILLLQ